MYCLIILDYPSAGASPYSMSGTPGPMMSPPPAEDSMGYGMPGMNGSGYSGVSHLSSSFLPSAARRPPPPRAEEGGAGQKDVLSRVHAGRQQTSVGHACTCTPEVRLCRFQEECERFRIVGKVLDSNGFHSCGNFLPYGDKRKKNVSIGM